MKVLHPAVWGESVIASQSQLVKSTQQSSVTAVGGHILVFEPEQPVTRRRKPASRIVSAKAVKTKVAPAPRTSPARTPLPSRRQPARQMTKALPRDTGPVFNAVNYEPEIFMKSFSALDRFEQQSKELQERVANPGRFL